MKDAPPICKHPEAQCPAVEAVSQLRAEISQLQRQVNTDALTQLFNKRHFNSALETEMERTRRNLIPTSLILVDLDHFKSINDTYGHTAGDRVLMAAASIFKNELRMIDIPCRYGGEEFAIVLPSTPLLTAAHVAERLRAALANAEIETSNTRIKITGSFGVASFYPEQKITPLQLVEKTDELLYQAKHKGRNQIACDTRPTTTPITADERAALFADDADAPDEQG
jgi:two-component system, cell cycle response regulator